MTLELHLSPLKYVQSQTVIATVLYSLKFTVPTVKL